MHIARTLFVDYLYPIFPDWFFQTIHVSRWFVIVTLVITAVLICFSTFLLFYTFWQCILSGYEKMTVTSLFRNLRDVIINILRHHGRWYVLSSGETNVKHVIKLCVHHNLKPECCLSDNVVMISQHANLFIVCKRNSKWEKW